MAKYFRVPTSALIEKHNPSPPIQPADDAAIKFALFGDVDVDDAVYDEVKRFAAFARTQAEKKQNR